MVWRAGLARACLPRGAPSGQYFLKGHLLPSPGLRELCPAGIAMTGPGKHESRALRKRTLRKGAACRYDLALSCTGGPGGFPRRENILSQPAPPASRAAARKWAPLALGTP